MGGNTTIGKPLKEETARGMGVAAWWRGSLLGRVALEIFAGNKYHQLVASKNHQRNITDFSEFLAGKFTSYGN